MTCSFFLKNEFLIRKLSTFSIKCTKLDYLPIFSSLQPVWNRFIGILSSFKKQKGHHYDALLYSSIRRTKKILILIYLLLSSISI